MIHIITVNHGSRAPGVVRRGRGEGAAWEESSCKGTQGHARLASRRHGTGLQCCTVLYSMCIGFITRFDIVIVMIILAVVGSVSSYSSRRFDFSPRA